MEQYITYLEEGEVHVRHEALHDEAVATKIRRFLPFLPGIKRVSVDTATATLVALYDAKKIDKEKLLQMLQKGESMLRKE